MDAALKELGKLEKLTSAAKGKSPAIQDSLDSLLQYLQDERDRVLTGTAAPESIGALSSNIENIKKDIDDRQKEIYNSLSRFGKALDKVGT
jgi:hypothetical protein